MNRILKFGLTVFVNLCCFGFSVIFCYLCLFRRKKSRVDRKDLEELGLVRNLEDDDLKLEEDDDENLIKIAHISDNHIHIGKFTKKELGPLGFFKKFVTNNFKGPKTFNNSIYHAGLADVLNERVNHVVHTGDVGVISIDREFKVAKKELIEKYVSKVPGYPNERNVSDIISISPGNHDYYLPRKSNFFMRHFDDTLPVSDDTFPYLKVIEDYVVLIIFSTRHESDLEKSASGSIRKQDIDKCERLLTEFFEENNRRREDYFLLVGMHHNPIMRYKLERLENIGGIKLRERKRFQDFVKHWNVRIVLCGHTHKWQNVFSNEETGSALIVDAGSINFVGTFLRAYPGYCVFTFDRNKGLVKFVRKTWNYERKIFVGKELRYDNKKQKFV